MTDGYREGNSAHKNDPCPISGCKSLASREEGRSLVCQKGHRVVNLDAPKAKGSGNAEG